MNRWADKVGQKSIAIFPRSHVGCAPLSESIAKLAPVAAPSATPATASLVVKGKLVSKTNPIRKEELLPYQEFLVGFVYDANKSLQASTREIFLYFPARNLRSVRPTALISVASYDSEVARCEATIPSRDSRLHHQDLFLAYSCSDLFDIINKFRPEFLYGSNSSFRIGVRFGNEFPFYANEAVAGVALGAATGASFAIDSLSGAHPTMTARKDRDPISAQTLSAHLFMSSPTKCSYPVPYVCRD